MWALRLVEGRTTQVNGTLTVVPGGCSNLDPPKETVQHPCGPLDIAWYVLAHLAVASGVADDLADTFYERLTGGQILVLEFDLRMRRVILDLTRLHAVDFSRHLWPYIEAAAFLAEDGSKFRSDPLNPSRGEIPSLPRATQDTRALASGTDAILAFMIAAVCTNSFHALPELAAEVEAEFGHDHPWVALMSRLRSLTPTAKATSFEDALIDSVRRFGSGHQTPQLITSAAIRFYQHAVRSNIKSHVFSVIAAWLRTEWSRIIAVESFRLTSPGRTVPIVKAALDMTTNDERFVATVLLAAVDATGVSVYSELWEELKKSAGHRVAHD